MPTRFQLHPQAQAMVDALAAGPALDYSRLSAAAFRSVFEVPAPSIARDDSVHISNELIDMAHGTIPVRIYRPQEQGPWPMTLYLHGGGFVIGSPAMTDGICAALAAQAGTLVISPHYRLAPESPFPAGPDDAAATLAWMHAHAAALGGEATRIAVAGDSSGGNFAAVLAQRARHQGPALRHQLLLYPVLDCRFDTASYGEFANGCFLTANMMKWFWRQYLGQASSGGDPSSLALARDMRVSPLQQAVLAGTCSATILTAECDVLRDEAEAYARALAAAGVRVDLRRWPGQIHGFLLMQGQVDDADLALAEAAAALKRAFE